MDLTTIGGLVFAIACILVGQALEGGHASSLMQLTAGIIVVGGTMGAVAVQFPGAVIKRALGAFKSVLLPTQYDTAAALKSIVAMANKARRDGLVSIEKDASALEDPFMRRAFEMAVDGTEAKTLRAALELEVAHVEEEGEGPIKVFEAAGGYSPTVGILGAVLGLIHVMENLSDPSKLGAGIAVAFVATVYGVASANLIFLPVSGKLKTRLRERVVLMELVMEGVCGLAEGENPRLIERKLHVYAHERESGATPEAAGAVARAAA
jgi:chemotaxis protein MotA